MEQLVAVYIATVQVNGMNLAIFITDIVVNTAAGVAAGGIDGDFVFAAFQTAAAPGLHDGIQNVKKLADAAALRGVAYAVAFCKSGADKAGLGT